VIFFILSCCLALPLYQSARGAGNPGKKIKKKKNASATKHNYGRYLARGWHSMLILFVLEKSALTQNQVLI